MQALCAAIYIFTEDVNKLASFVLWLDKKYKISGKIRVFSHVIHSLQMVSLLLRSVVTMETRPVSDKQSGLEAAGMY